MNSLCEDTEMGEATRLSGHCQSWSLGGVWGVTEDRPREVVRSQIVKNIVCYVRNMCFI